MPGYRPQETNQFGGFWCFEYYCKLTGLSMPDGLHAVGARVQAGPNDPYTVPSHSVQGLVCVTNKLQQK